MNARQCLSRAWTVRRSFQDTIPQRRQFSRFASMRSMTSIAVNLPGLEEKTDVYHYPALWLRDHCQCPECRHPETKQRLLDTFSLPKDINATEVVSRDDGVHIQWNHKDHKSHYPTAWLRKHRIVHKENRYPKRQWAKHEKEKLPEMEYGKIMESDQGVAAWTQKIYAHGFCFVNNVPTNPEDTQRLLERIAFIRHTHYGGFWDFTSDLSSKDTAYTSLGLPLHTDTAYFTDPCGLQLFHLLSHSPSNGSNKDADTDLGGHNTMCDGYKTARLLQKRHEWAYKALSEIPIPYHASGNEDQSIQPASEFPVFSTTSRGLQIRWNNDDRGTKSNWGESKDNVRLWYAAAKLWTGVLKQHTIETKFEPGRALIFDNWRILHGRTAFTGERRMCGGYISHDDFYSRYRMTNFGRERVLLEV